MVQSFMVGICEESDKCQTVIEGRSYASFSSRIASSAKGSHTSDSEMTSVDFPFGDVGGLPGWHSIRCKIVNSPKTTSTSIVI